MPMRMPMFETSVLAFYDDDSGRDRGYGKKALYKTFLMKDIDDPRSSDIYKLPYIIKGTSYGVGGPASSAIISHMNKFFIIGGTGTKLIPKTRVIIYDLDECIEYQGPSLNHAIPYPFVVPISTKLYCFPRGFDAKSLRLELSSDTNLLALAFHLRLEVLDTSLPVLAWDDLVVKLELPLKFRPPKKIAPLYEYHIDAYAPSLRGLYLSVKDCCSFFICSLDDNSHISLRSPNELPFLDEAKQMGSEGLYVGLQRYEGLLGIYKLVEDTNDVDVFYFDILCVLFFPFIPNENCVGLDYFQPVSSNIVCVVRTCTRGVPSSWDTIPTKAHVVVQAFQLTDETNATSSSAHSKKRKRMNGDDPPRNLQLIWEKQYPTMPVPETWCFIPNSDTLSYKLKGRKDRLIIRETESTQNRLGCHCCCCCCCCCCSRRAGCRKIY